MSDTALLTDRRLDWPACYNVRDLGGLPTADGAVIRAGAIVRADMLYRLEPAGWQALLDYGVRTIVDLRSPLEHEKEPYTVSSAAAQIAGVIHLRMPLTPPEPRMDAALARVGIAEAYVLLVDHYTSTIATVLRAVASARTGGVVIHCHGGRDRTGIVAALLLGLAGVPAEEIAADYAASREQLWPLWEKLVAEAGSEEAAGMHLKPMLEADTMRYLLAHLDTRYGGAAGYMAHIGLTGAEREDLAARMVEA